VRAGAAAIVFALAGAACDNPLGRQYEYEEQLYLRVTGEATVVVDTSIAALVALRGAPFDALPSKRIDRTEIRRLYESGGGHGRQRRPAGTATGPPFRAVSDPTPRRAPALEVLASKLADVPARTGGGAPALPPDGRRARGARSRRHQLGRPGARRVQSAHAEP